MPLILSWPGAGGPNPTQRFQPAPGATTAGTPAAPLTTQKTQAFKIRVQVATQKTQAFKLRVQVTTQVTQPFTTRVEGVTQVTQPFKTRIQSSTQATQPFTIRTSQATQVTQPFRIRVGTPNLNVLPPAPPGLTVQYGSFTLDESNGILITSEYDSGDTSQFGAWYVEFRCRLTPDRVTGNTATDDTAFTALVNTLETQLRIPRQTLLVKMGTKLVRNWDFNQAAQTAFMISPELKLLRDNRRDYTYGLTIHCQFPGNIPGNAFRRESLTTVGDSLRERRTCTISATWTSGPGKTAYAQFLANADDFCTAYLPKNGNDQYGIAGTWVRADQNPAFQDENSLLTVTRTFWEVFSGRRDSAAKAVTTIGDRRVFTAPSAWVASQGTFTALQNYIQGGDPFYAKIMPAQSEPNASWVLVDEEPSYNDQNGILTVVRIYHEVVNGQREYTVKVNTTPAQIRQVVISGTYYATQQTAYLNYKNNVQTLVSGILAGLTPPVTRFESKSVPKYEGYDQNTKRYSFVWTINEIAYPQGVGGTDDPNITISTLEISSRTPLDPQTFTEANVVTRLATCKAVFTATIDYTKNQDPVKLWQGGLKNFVLNAIATKLGPNNVKVEVVDEDVHGGLHNNTIMGTLWLIVTGGTVLSLEITQEVIQDPGRDFVALADGAPFSFYPYRGVAQKFLHRTAVAEYAFGWSFNVFESGDAQASGFGMVDTGISAQDSITAQQDLGPLDVGTGWFLLKPFRSVDIPRTRGISFQTVVHIQEELWMYVGTLAPGSELS